MQNINTNNVQYQTLKEKINSYKHGALRYNPLTFRMEAAQNISTLVCAS